MDHDPPRALLNVEPHSARLHQLARQRHRIRILYQLMSLNIYKKQKSAQAFIFQALNLFEDHKDLYFWTLTFYHVHSDWECHKRFSNFLRHLRKVVGRGWGGVRVSELHEEHGVHFHLIVSERLAADLVRRVGRCYGFGRVHVERVFDQRGAIDYLAKYLTKQRDHPKTESGRSCRKWASFGDIRRTRVKDMENAGTYWRFRKARNLPWTSWRQEHLIDRSWIISEDQAELCHNYALQGDNQMQCYLATEKYLAQWTRNRTSLFAAERDPMKNPAYVAPF